MTFKEFEEAVQPIVDKYKRGEKFMPEEFSKITACIVLLQMKMEKELQDNF